MPRHCLAWGGGKPQFLFPKYPILSSQVLEVHLCRPVVFFLSVFAHSAAVPPVRYVFSTNSFDLRCCRFPLVQLMDVPVINQPQSRNHRFPFEIRPRLLIEQTARMGITVIRRNVNILVRMLRHTEIRRRKHRIDDTSRRSSSHWRDGRDGLRLLHASIATTTARRRHTARAFVRHLRRAGRIAAMRDGAWYRVAVGRDVWLLLREGRVLVPAPALFEFLEHKRDTPAGFFVDLGEDLQYLFLLTAVC